MKKHILLLATILLFSICLTGCMLNNTNSENNTETTSIQSSVSINTENQSEKLQKLESEYNNVTKIYDESLENAIKTYCEKYLSYTGSATDKYDFVKDVVTDSYYSELQSKNGHLKNDDEKDYEQSTGVDKLFYDNYSSPSNEVKVAAVCKQTIIYDNDVTNKNAIYFFKMKYVDKTWKIDDVENINLE